MLNWKKTNLSCSQKLSGALRAWELEFPASHIPRVPPLGMHTRHTALHLKVYFQSEHKVSRNRNSLDCLLCVHMVLLSLDLMNWTWWIVSNPFTECETPYWSRWAIMLESYCFSKAAREHRSTGRGASQSCHRKGTDRPLSLKVESGSSESDWLGFRVPGKWP